jgi:hypothetical protein
VLRILCSSAASCSSLDGDEDGVGTVSGAEADTLVAVGGIDFVSRIDDDLTGTDAAGNEASLTVLILSKVSREMITNEGPRKNQKLFQKRWK